MFGLDRPTATDAAKPDRGEHRRCWAAPTDRRRGRFRLTGTRCPLRGHRGLPDGPDVRPPSDVGLGPCRRTKVVVVRVSSRSSAPSTHRTCFGLGTLLCDRPHVSLAAGHRSFGVPVTAGQPGISISGTASSRSSRCAYEWVNAWIWSCVAQAQRRSVGRCSAGRRGSRPQMQCGSAPRRSFPPSADVAIWTAFWWQPTCADEKPPGGALFVDLLQSSCTRSDITALGLRCPRRGPVQRSGWRGSHMRESNCSSYALPLG
jgi:hypothetical protein